MISYMIWGSHKYGSPLSDGRRCRDTLDPRLLHIFIHVPPVAVIELPGGTDGLSHLQSALSDTEIGSSRWLLVGRFPIRLLESNCIEQLCGPPYAGPSQPRSSPSPSLKRRRRQTMQLPVSCPRPCRSILKSRQSWLPMRRTRPLQHQARAAPPAPALRRPLQNQ